MKITDVSCVQSLRFSNIIIIDCNHEDIYKNEFRHEIFVLSKNNEQIAHFESNHSIRVADLDESCNLFTFENFETETDQLQLYRIEKDNSYTYLNTYEDIEEGIEDGYFAVKRNGLYGFINANGDEVIKPQYEEYRSFLDGYAIVRKNKKWGLIDKQNNIIIPFKYSIWNFPAGGYVVMENYNHACNYTTDVYNLCGEIVYQVPNAYRDVYNLGNGSLLVRNQSTDEFEIVDLNKSRSISNAKELNSIKQYFQPQTLITIGGRPYVGRRRFSLDLAERFCMDNKKCLYIYDKDCIRVPSLLAGNIATRKGMNDFGQCLYGLKSFGFIDYYIDNFSINDMKKAIQLYKPDCLFIDLRNSKNRLMPETLKKIAVENNLIIFVITKTCRESCYTTNCYPEVKNIQNKNLLKYSDVVLLLYREDYYNCEISDDKRNIIEIILAKPENNSIKLQFNRKTGKIRTSK